MEVARRGGRAGTGPVFFKVLFKLSHNIFLLADDALIVRNECCTKSKKEAVSYPTMTRRKVASGCIVLDL